MQIIAFDYNKAGKVSRRMLVAFSKPTEFYAGIDISELDHEDQAWYITELEKAHKEYLEKIAELEKEYDLKHRYRQFVPSKMENVTVVEEI